MCDNCFNIEISNFDSETQFLEFEKELTIKLGNGKSIKAIEQGKSHRSVYFDTYKCNECETPWCLSTPDQAWRGFFLPYHKCISHIDSLKKSDRLKGIVGIAILLIIIIVIVINLF
jgi:hypothetical protein